MKFKPILVLVSFFACAAAAFADVDFAEINKKFGINMLKDANLFDDSPAEFAKRLGPKFEKTKVASGEIWTSYAKGKVLGVSLEQMRFKAVDGKVSQVDMVFFNKGDSAKGDKWTPQMQRQMKKTHDELGEQLDSFAGKSVQGTWGYGRVKNKAQIWTLENYVFTLEFKPKEFIVLHILPKSASGGAPAASQKKTVSDDFDGKANVKTDENGDVHIANIPMVDQGPKGYCVPATMERILKYYNIPDVDMHKIAAACKTNVGGGTTLNNVMNDFKKVCSTFKLKMAKVNGFTLNSISSMIDRGIPVCWTLFSTDAYMKRMVENSDKRTTANFAEYAKTLKDQPKIKREMKNAHLCLIIGYNKKSKEIAVSNSWGEQYSIHWVRFDDAKIIGRDVFFISPR